MKTTLITLSLMTISWSWGQSPDSLRALELYQEAEAHYNKSEFDSAYHYYQRALSLYESAEDWEDYSMCLYDMGYVSYDLKKYDRSDSLFKKGMAVAENKVGRQSLSWIKNCYGRVLRKNRINEFDSILYFIDIALAEMGEGIEYETMKLEFLDKRASTYNRLGVYKSSIATWLKYIDVVNEHFDRDTTELIFAYERLGYNYGLDRNYIQADGYLNRVLEYRKDKATTSADKVRLAQLYNSIGAAYLRSRRFSAARDAYKTANRIAVEELGENSAGAIYTLSNVGLTYIGIKDDSASWFLEKALEKEIAHMPNQKFVIGNTYLNLGMTQRNLSKNAESFDSYRNAISNIRQTTKGFHNYFSKCYNELGAISMDLGLLDSASTYFDKAIEANILNDNFNSQQLSDEPSDYLSLHNMITSIYGRAQLLLKSEAKNDQSSLNAMIKQLNIGILLIDKFMRNLSIQEKTEDSLNGLLHKLNLHSSEITLRLYELTDDEKYLAEFLRYAELDRASGLRALISKENAIKAVGLPDSIRGKLRSLDQKVSSAKSQVVRNPDNNAEGWRNLQEVTQIRDEYYGSIEDRYPLFENLRVQDDLQIEKIQASLSEDQWIVEYFMGLENTFALLLDKESIKIFELASNQLIDSLVQKQQENTNYQDFASFSEVSFMLYKNLFSEIDSYITNNSDSEKRVVIVPDGSINYISFSSLSTDSVSSSYLMEKYPISYEPSALVSTQRELKGGNRFSFLGVASDFTTENNGSLLASADLEIVRDTLKPLPGVIKEVNLISDMISGDVFVGENATEKNFKENASGYGAIHLATHAIVDNKNPSYSKLFFDTRSDEVDDGELHAYEIYNLNLNAQLVTLSACNTGVGRIREGEGAMSLSHAFSYAGVPATVVSLWPASDKSTPELMKFFYQNLKDGQPKDIALNNARKEYLKTAQGKARHPFYWGGFVLIGDNSAIEEDRNLLVYTIAAALIIVMILTLYKRKQSAA